MGIETGLAVASMGLSAAGGLLSASGKKAEYTANAEAAAYKAAVGQINANAARAQGTVQAQNYGMKANAVLGAQRAAYGASGIDVNSGSPAAVAESSASMARLDTATILYNADVTAKSFETQAQLDTATSKNLKTAGNLAFANSLLGAATGTADKWLKFKSVGVF